MFLADRAVVGGLLGLAVGSFLNVVIHRAPRGETPWRPRRSYCPSCRAPIRAFDNVPIWSYLRLRGRCRVCRAPVPLRYPLVEAATGGLFAVLFGAVADGRELVASTAFGAFLLTLAVVDLETRRLPTTLVLIGAAVAVALRVVEASGAGSVSPFLGSLASGLVGYSVLAAARWLGGLAFGREAMGEGDAKFLGAIGLFLGDWRLVLLTVGLSAFIGSVVGVVGIASRRVQMSSAIPYGPFLALGAGVSRLWGERWLELYVSALR